MMGQVHGACYSGIFSASSQQRKQLHLQPQIREFGGIWRRTPEATQGLSVSIRSLSICLHERFTSNLQSSRKQVEVVGKESKEIKTI